MKLISRKKPQIQKIFFIYDGESFEVFPLRKYQIVLMETYSR